MALPVIPGLKIGDPDAAAAAAAAAAASAPTTSNLPVVPGLKIGAPAAQSGGDATTTLATLPAQGGMTPWRAATANPVEDIQANRAWELHTKFGTPLPPNFYQHIEPETLAQAGAALTQDPMGLAANVAQGATLHGAGYFFPGVKRRAESYSGMHPTAGALGEMAGGAVPTLITGGAADLAAAPLAARPLVQALVRYAPSVALGGTQGLVNTPADAPLGSKVINATTGALTGLGGQAITDMTGNVVNRLETGRMPAWRPVVRPLATGTAKTGAIAAALVPAALGMHHVIPFSEGAMGLLPFVHDIRSAMLSGPKDIGTGLSNLTSNLYRTLSTPSGPARVGGRFAPGAFPPGRSAIPGALAAPYLAGLTTPSPLARLYAEHHYDPNAPPAPPSF
jgi:hypothetical protein